MEKEKKSISDEMTESIKASIIDQVKAEMLSKEDGKLVIEIIERKGEAPLLLPPVVPQIVFITGQIDAVSRYTDKRMHLIDVNHSSITINRKDGFIILETNEHQSSEKEIIKGLIEKNPFIEKLGLNTEKAYTPKDLGKFIRLNKRFFTNKESATGLVSLLFNYKAKINSEFEDQDNKRGSVKRSRSQIVDSNIPEKFQLKIALIEGQTPAILDVSIEIDENMNCYLICDELETLYEAEVNALFDAEIAKFENLLIVEV